MARKLKSYQTSQGFFDLAIAAPSMKAALEAWGSDMNLFHKGFAWESDDPAIIKATLAKPGTVLKRPVGSKQRLSEHAHLPKDLPSDTAVLRKPAPTRKTKAKRTSRSDDKAARKAAIRYEREERKREQQRRKWEAAEAKKRAKRDRAAEKARQALEKARKEHDAITDAIDRDRAVLDERAAAEDARWFKVKDRLDRTAKS